MGHSTPAMVTLTVNGDERHVVVEPRRTLLDTIRHDLGLTGTKKVCDMGNCGACTVLIDGQAMYSCLVLAVDVGDRPFIEEDAFQCGYCTPGQIMSLRALLNDEPEPTEDQIRRAVSGNLCRCSAYPHIVAAGQRAARLQTASAEG
jgi:aerobic-type carbon monoxide dehydrogenase small subunit (CoxS/CutS family)